MKKLLIILMLFSVTVSCERQIKALDVQSYKTRSESDDDWIYWYIITQPSGGYYYASSPTPVSSFSNVSWSQSDSKPEGLEQATEVQELGEVTVEVDNLSEEMQTEIDTTPEDFGGMTADEMGDYEGGGDADSGENSSDSGSDSGDSGGGDSGGGDGGGGE